MKMSHLLLVALIGLLCYFHYHPAATIEHSPAEPSPTPANQATTPIAKASPSIASPHAQASHTQELSELRREINQAPHVRLDARIVQHLGEGRLLVSAFYLVAGAIPYGTFELMGFPDGDSLADGETVHCMVAKVGTFNYATTDGASSTIYRLVDVDNPEVTGVQAEPTPANAWRFGAQPLDGGAYNRR